MTILEEALAEAIDFIDQLRLPYMLIGGLAVAEWGEPRATLDVDLTIWVEPDQFETTVKALAERFQVRGQDWFRLTSQSRVLPVRASNGVLVDLLFAVWPVEQRAIEGAVTRHIAGKAVRVASLDYLLFLKLISDRPKDLEDASRLLRRHRDTANLSWLEKELGGLAESMAQPEILERFQRLVRRSP